MTRPKKLLIAPDAMPVLWMTEADVAIDGGAVRIIGMVESRDGAGKACRRVVARLVLPPYAAGALERGIKAALATLTTTKR
jgi:hypothetical protein